MIFGTYDKLHKGHLNFFKQARKHGDYLIAVVARDKTVKKIKGRLPRQKERERLFFVSQKADKALLGSLKNRYAVIKKYRPDMICLGYDQEADIKKIKKFRIPIKRLKPFKPEIYKSSLIR
jgi:FAD synthetase